MADGKRLKNGFKGLMAQFDVDWTPKEVDQDGNVINPASFKFREDNLAIDRFKAVMDVGARPNRYEVTISCPKLGGIAIEGLRCIEASLPGRQLQTQDFSEYGATRKYPYQVQHDEGQVSLQFLCDSTFNDRFIMEAWQTLIFSDVDESYSIQGGSASNPQFMYYRDYIGSMTITQMRMDGGPALTYDFQEVYPVSFSAQPLSYASSNEIMKFECSMAFRTFTTTYQQREEGFIDKLNKGSKALNALGGLANLLGKGEDFKNISKFQNRINKLSGNLKPFERIG